MQMDVRDSSFFSDESFDCVIDKGAYMCAYLSFNLVPVEASFVVLKKVKKTEIN
jgi:hypothetical protein